MLRIFHIFLISVTFVLQCESARILGLFTAPSKSHLIVHTSIIDALVERGHEATVVTTVPIPKKNIKYKHIHLNVAGFPPGFLSEMINDPQPIYKRFSSMMEKIMAGANASLHEPEMKQILEKESFDLVILGYFFNEFQLGVAAHFKCPVIVSFMVKPIRILNDMVGNPKELAYVPNPFSEAKQPMNFWARVKNLLFIVFFEELLIPLLSGSKQTAFYKFNFPPEKYPSLDEMRKNVSLVLTNHHFSQGPIRPYVPAMIDIGGIQIDEKPQPLPEDIKHVLDNAKKGVIYFSFGSLVQASSIDQTRVKIMFDVLSKLPQTILWKWNEDDIPGKSPNIVYKSWLPQADILAHPNVKLFITHVGQGGAVEAEYNGVPMVGVPLFGEQHANMADVENAGFGVRVDFATLTKESFGAAVHEVLSNKKYREKVQQFSKLYRDRPMTARETAVYWIEYVLRHRGAPHMQSPAVHLNSLQLMSLDVIAFLVGVAYVIFKLIKVSCSLICSKKSSKAKNKRE